MEQKNKFDIKKSLLLFLIIAILIIIIIYLILKLNNIEKSNSGTSAESISSKYDDKTYASSTDLKSTTITDGGSYNITGEYGCITINTSNEVELNLENATITCESGPAINVESAKLVSIKLSEKNKIVSKTVEDLDGAIYSKSDLVFSGDGSIEIESNYDGIVSKDELVIKSGTYIINTDDDGMRGKDNVAIVDGTFTINASGDGIKSTNDEDEAKGYIVIDDGVFNITSVGDGIQAETSITINGGTFDIKTTGNANSTSAKGIKSGKLIEINDGIITINSTDDGIHSNGNITISKGKFEITSKDDAIHADGKIEINGGTFDITAAEGIEATYVRINDGNINISASDDGINAGNKSDDYSIVVEINGGYLTIKMGEGDTDGIDSNGSLYINGGTIDITAQSPFDYDKEAKHTGGTIIVNGEETNTITNQMMGGGPGNMGGNFGRR